MSTPKQIAANTTNAKRSTGPRTPQGKARSSRNAVKFGLFSGTFTQPGEEPAYAAFRAALHETFASRTAGEEAIVEKILQGVWRLRRCNQVEMTHVIPLDRTIRRARSQAKRLLRKSIAELKKQKSDSQKRTQFPLAA
jgi:hypothetical protein